MKRAAGFSLLELIVVLSIFALVALIGVQVIQATVRSSDKLTEINEASGELAVGLALLRQDLNAAMPWTFTTPNDRREAALRVGPGASFGLTVGGLAPVQPHASGQGRVVWRLDTATGQLFRQVWTTRHPAGGRPGEVLVMHGVRNLEVANYTVENGWRPGFTADPRNISKLPLGVRVRISHDRADSIDTVVSLR